MAFSVEMVTYNSVWWINVILNWYFTLFLGTYYAVMVGQVLDRAMQVSFLYRVQCDILASQAVRKSPRTAIIAVFKELEELQR